MPTTNPIELCRGQRTRLNNHKLYKQSREGRDSLIGLIQIIKPTRWRKEKQTTIQLRYKRETNLQGLNLIEPKSNNSNLVKLLKQIDRSNRINSHLNKYSSLIKIVSMKAKIHPKIKNHSGNNNPLSKILKRKPN